MTTLRRVSPGALYEATYKWDGSCRCGANEWEWEWWDGGYSVHCCLCRWWQCDHLSTGIRHTSDGLWTGGSRKSTPPTGCPCLQNTPRTSSTPSISGASDAEQALPVPALSSHTGENRAFSSHHPTACRRPPSGGGSLTGAIRRPLLSRKGVVAYALGPFPNSFVRKVLGSAGARDLRPRTAILSPPPPPTGPAGQTYPPRHDGRPGPSFEVAMI